MLIRRVLLALALLAVVGKASAQGTHESADCIEEPAGFVVRCGYVRLPQDYANPSRGHVDIYYTQIHSDGVNAKADPLVYLVGGPGSSGSHLLSTSFRAYLRAFVGDRDIVVIDQRGTGLSHPSLYCLEVLRRLADILQSRHAEHAELVLSILRDCQRRLSRHNIHFDTFHTENNARDVANVLLALGYDQWNLVGVSYGSRLALAMMRDYPQYLRSVILDSVYPPQADIYLDAYYSGERALQQLFAACRASERCHQHYPELGTVFYRLYHRLNANPLYVTYEPPAYQRLDIEISGYRLYDWVFSWLYDVSFIRLIPRLLYELDQGQSDEAIMVGVAHEATLRDMHLGMHYTVQCQEEYISDRRRDYASVIARHPHLSGYLSYPVEGSATLSRLCAMWQAQPRPSSANHPITSDVPTLLLSGNFDPITPPSYAAAAQESLSVSYNFVFPHVGHGVLRSDACAVKIALDFIAEPLSEPDSRCIAETASIDFD